MKINKNTRRVLLVLVVIGVLVGAWAVWYVFYKPHRNVAGEKAAYELKATELSEAFKTDTSAMSKYIDKAILIEGSISSIEGNHVAFDNVICNFQENAAAQISGLKVGQPVKVQGRLTTHNDLLEEIMLDQCVIK